MVIAKHGTSAPVSVSVSLCRFNHVVDVLLKSETSSIAFILQQIEKKMAFYLLLWYLLPSECDENPEEYKHQVLLTPMEDVWFHPVLAFPLKQRRSKGNEVPSDVIIKEKDHKDDGTNEVIKTQDGKDDYSNDVIKKKDDKSAPTVEDKQNNDDKDDLSSPIVEHKQAPDSQEKGKIKNPKKKTMVKNHDEKDDLSAPIIEHKQDPDSQEKDKMKNPRKKAATPLKVERLEGISLEKLSVAKTVVIGGLLNAEMAEDVHRIAKECGTVSSITYPLPKDETTHHGKDVRHTLPQSLSLAHKI
ncbi:hypothetical protein L2E82_26958 [Cichorium intybus]|uniref:Uncharacterized protein n=1 Tax=Cichorium intybus TaxID=13427 RepID=A0ACB9CS19_CICIN|nr:hypothetical protein L2E82_26958 [Cichorium intybus]